MINKTILTIALTTFIFSYQAFNQADSLIDISFEKPNIKKVRRYVISIDPVAYLPYVMDGEGEIGKGIGFERLGKNNTSYFVLFKHVYMDWYEEKRTIYNIIVGKRFYFSRNKIKSYKINSDTYTLQKALHVPKGIYVSILGQMMGHYVTYMNTDGMGNLTEGYRRYYNHHFGLGISLGYQLVLPHFLSFNISLPISIGYQLESKPDKFFNRILPSIIPLPNINIGIAL